MKILFPPWAEQKAPSIPPREAVGGKGHGLYWLADHRFPTPPTWVLSTVAYDLVVEREELAESIATIGRTLAEPGKDWAALQKRLEELEPLRNEIVTGLEQASLPDQVGRAIEELVLRPTQWAVRSSATVEDDPRHSFAGQFQSFISVPPGRAIWKRIRQVWASNLSREAISYCAQNGIGIPKMAVILQPMEPITARDRSGVAFSQSPVPSLSGVLIQAAFGAGVTIVGGYGGDLYSVTEEACQVEPVPLDQIYVSGPEGGLVARSVPPRLVLTDEEARELAALILAVAEKWGEATNVEFVWRAGASPTLVQVRSAK